MRSHRFVNSLLYLVIQLLAKESNAKENNAFLRCFFVLLLDKRYVFKGLITLGFSAPGLSFKPPDRVEMRLLLHAYFQHFALGMKKQAIINISPPGMKKRDMYNLSHMRQWRFNPGLETRLRLHGHAHFENSGD